MQCDMCGSDERLYTALIEGTRLKVCKNCSKYGKIISESKPVQIKRKQVIEKPEIVEGITPDFGELIRQARQKTGLKQEDVAKKLNEKESLYQKIESGKIQPSLKLARKLEKFFHIKLIEQDQKVAYVKDKKEAGAMTIGDLIKYR